ncbi:6-phosphofructokinase [Macrolepiota fuliginosa MF-IS2]|uniref:ATP-dependent 6-phosphofructokinase n=1 Tax=Macrolepiota fuliginosa MF-IS2 TaxID=1400762 RepID=A0A9P5XG50_9AGAR|nr:6-phosphofructokinase [Macrolepiota fuliginosa MF-IS2]
MKIAILTSGGDSAGMNAVVRSVVKAGILKGCEMWVVREGYEGLVRGNTYVGQEQGDVVNAASEAEVLAQAETVANDSIKGQSWLYGRKPDENLVRNMRFGDGDLLRDGTSEYVGGRTLKGRYIVRVGWDDVRGWFSQGGTLIGTARSATFRTHEGRLAAAHNLIKEGIDALVVCGGDGSLTGADVFRSEWPSLIEELRNQGTVTAEQFDKHSHLRICGLVGSIDNDMSLTDLTIGAPTALQRICEAIDNINSTAYSHSRAFVVEVMGRDCGWLAVLAGVAGGADFIFIPERPPKVNPWEDEMCLEIQKHRAIGKRKTIVIVAEGAHDLDLKPIHAEYIKDVLTERLGLDTRVTTLGHTQRGGAPCAMDRILPTLQGVEAVNAILEAAPGTPSYMIGIQENKITRVPLMEAVEKTRDVARAVKAKDFDCALAARGTEFVEYFEAFTSVASLFNESTQLPPELRMRVGIIHMGAPAGGMNAATRTLARYCIRQGHTPLAIHNGFRGLLDDNVDELSWLGVDAWSARGGSELGTNRSLPSTDLGGVASQFQKYAFDAIVIIGGFEGFHSLLLLEEGRKHYPAFHIPMVHLPATISNNVPLTEYSLGSDTSLNALVSACDSIKQSASASRDRVFVIETQGGKCGYIATMGALATGAMLVYTPEEGITLDMLRRDVRFLKTRYAFDIKGKREGRIIIRGEASSNIYSTSVLTKMFQEEGGNLFDARSASLGHTLQGGVPSPLDRARAVRLSLKCMVFLEQHHQDFLKQGPKRTASPETAAVITVQASSLKWVPVQQMHLHADMQNRRGKEAWWSDIKDLVESLVAKPQFLGIPKNELHTNNLRI